MKINQYQNRRLYPLIFDQFYYLIVLLRMHITEIKIKYIKKVSLLVDFGCGSMPYRPIFEPGVVKYIGVDLTRNKKADLFIDSDSRIPLRDSCADVVLSTQVLEHVKDPLRYLMECYRILKPDGILILSTHGHWVYHPAPEDYWRWTRFGLSMLCEQSNFQIMEVRGLMEMVPTALQLFQDSLLCKVPTRFLKKIFIFILQSLIMVCDKCYSKKSKVIDAGVLLIVAKKKMLSERL